MRNGTGVESTIGIGYGSRRSNRGGFSENGGFYESDVSSEACECISIKGSGECCRSCNNGGDIYSRESCCRSSSDGLDDFVRGFVVYLGFVVEFVGKIRLFVYDEKGSGSEEIGGTGIIEEEGRDISYPGFFAICSAAELDISGVVPVDSGLEGRVCCVGGGDEWRRVVCYGILESGGYLVLGLGGVRSVDIAGFGERICWGFVYADITGNSVSDGSYGREDVSVNRSGSGDSFGNRVRSGFYLVQIESALYIAESGNSVGITGIS